MNANIINHPGRLNHRYGKLDENGEIIFAPANLFHRGVLYGAPTAEQYAAAGWLPAVSEPPPPRDGYTYLPVRWERVEGQIRRVYEEVADIPAEPPQKTYNKYRLGVAIEAAGHLDALMAYFAANTAAKFHWDNAQDFTDTDANFQSVVAAFEAQMGADAVAAILAEAEVR